MMPRFWIVLGGLLAAAAVVAGAFGAHAMKDPKLEDLWYLQGTGMELPQMDKLAGQWRQSMDMFETAVRYHMYNALGLIACGILAVVRKSLWAEVAGICFAFGFLLFCVPVYALVFDGPRFLGALAPIGGVSMIAGWLLISVSALNRGPQPTATDD